MGNLYNTYNNIVVHYNYALIEEILNKIIQYNCYSVIFKYYCFKVNFDRPPHSGCDNIFDFNINKIYEILKDRKIQSYL